MMARGTLKLKLAENSGRGVIPATIAPHWIIAVYYLDLDDADIANAAADRRRIHTIFESSAFAVDQTCTRIRSDGLSIRAVGRYDFIPAARILKICALYEAGNDATSS